MFKNSFEGLLAFCYYVIDFPEQFCFVISCLYVENTVDGL